MDSEISPLALAIDALAKADHAARRLYGEPGETEALRAVAEIAERVTNIQAKTRQANSAFAKLEREWQKVRGKEGVPPSPIDWLRGVFAGEAARDKPAKPSRRSI